MKLGIIGSGMIVKDFLSFAHELLEIKLEAITARNIENLKDLQSKYNIKNIITQIIVIIIVFTIIILQNSFIIFQTLKKKIIVKSIHGTGFFKTYGNILLVLTSTWIIQITIEYLL
ncbi:MAG: DUF1430 domain-containing protein, partial [Gemella haemolysans]|nr:DUF1430 domain-containing protein [Gemella haemolysans]